MIRNPNKTPFPWFGGKADAAPSVWAALGDVDHYVEPFGGSLAVLLRRPAVANRAYRSETVNDIDGLLVNAWRGIQLSPGATAEAASWPVTEADLHARHLALLRWRADNQLEHLMGDPHWHDPVMAGWWLWGQSAWIGSGWCSGKGAWIVGADGRIEKSAGRTGIARQLPHLANDGQGINHAGTRERGVGPAGGNIGEAMHPMTMPELRRWMEFLSARLRHVRILNGDWTRAVTSGAAFTIGARRGGACGVFLDPPYTPGKRQADLYVHDGAETAAAVREWAIGAGKDARFRLVLAGFDDEHNSLLEHNWKVAEWFKSGYLKGGRKTGTATTRHQQHRERLWLSPHCLPLETT